MGLGFGDREDALLQDRVQFLHILVQRLLGAISILDECQVPSDPIGQFFGDLLPLLGVELMIVKLQVNLADVDLLLIEEGELVGAIGDLGDLEKGPSEDLLLVLLDTEVGLELLFLGVDLHGEGLVPVQIFLLDEERSGLEALLADVQPHICPFLDIVQHDGLNNRSLKCPLWRITVILYLCLFLLILKDANFHLASSLAHKANIEGKVLVDVLLLPKVNQAHA